MIGSGTTGGDLDTIDNDIFVHRGICVKIIAGTVFAGVPAHKVLGARSRVGRHIFTERGTPIYIQNIVDRPVGRPDRLVHEGHCILAYGSCVILKGQFRIFQYTFCILEVEVLSMEDGFHTVLYLTHIPPCMGIIQGHHNSVDFAGGDLLPGVIGKIALVRIAIGIVFWHNIAVCIRAVFCKKADTGNSNPAYIICVIASSGNGCGFPVALIHKPDPVYGFIASRCERRNRQQRQHHAEDHEC